MQCPTCGAEVPSKANPAILAADNARLIQEVAEARQQQAATSEILRVISNSPTDVRRVFDAIANIAPRLCDANYCLLYRFDGELLHLVAHYNVTGELLEILQRLYPMRPSRIHATGRAIMNAAVVEIEDALSDPEYDQKVAVMGGWRSMIAVPMLREAIPIGTIVIQRAEAGRFPEGQIALLKTFADQAVIALENTRLFDAEQARTRELSRSVAELKALSEVGQAVNASLDLRTVLNAILTHACEISDSGGGAIYVFDETRSAFVLEAGRNMSDELIAAVRVHEVALGDTLVARCAERREAVQIEDLTKAPPHPLFEMHIKEGVRALLAVPLLHQDRVIGALVVRRNRAAAFAPETVSLLQSFASQSAIAIENARLFEEIARKGRELELASQHKSQFVANMSHELRTPLAAMLGYAELMQEGFYGALPDRAKAILARLQSNGKHLLGLINSVLDIAKIEAGQFSLNLLEYSLDGIVETVRVATESLAEGKKLSLKTDVAKGLPCGLGDEQRISQVLLNLVGNAIKFTDSGEVRISAGAVDGHFSIRVSDTGPGIPVGEQARIFEEFHQIDNSNTKTKGGTGLGLAIAKQIIEMHGGRIWVESTLGQGATFQIELPIRAENIESAA
jgi:signal transduction histidine kinase